MADRLDRARSDDQSCTVRPCNVSGVGLATIPETTTFPLGVAVVGLNDVIAIHGCDRAPGWLAAAGTVASHPTPTAAADAAAASRSHRRVAARPRAVLARGDAPPPRGQAPGPHGPEPPGSRTHAMPKCYCRSSAAVCAPRSSLEDAGWGRGSGTLPPMCARVPGPLPIG